MPYLKPWNYINDYLAVQYVSFLVPQVLVDFQENPSAAQAHLKNPGVMQKIQKLVSAGIVQMK